MAAPVLNAKFLRAFHINPAPGFGTDGCMSWILRLCLEFWGFCVNGSNDLVNPGLGSVTPGVFTNMPDGWLSGSNVLIASGSDGVTVAGLPYFNVTGSQPFPHSIEGKWITLWQSGSTSTDDSIYKIRKWLNSSSLLLDPTYGGTPPDPYSQPTFTDRAGINYRVIDYLAAADVGSYVPGLFVNLQFPRAPQINPGQAIPQCSLSCSNANSNISQLRIILSPSGSWDGVKFFADPSQPIVPETTSNGPGGGGWVTPDWFHNSGGGDGYVMIIAGNGFIICQAGGNFMPNGGSSFHIEVPTRLYPQANDPNPICANNFGNLGVNTGAQVGYGYAHFHFPSPYDTVTRRWPCMVRGYTGSSWNGTIWGGTQQGLNMGRWANMFFNPIQIKFLFPEPILSLPSVNGQASAVGQFSFARARVRSVRYIGGGYPYYMRIGDGTDRWIHAGGGVMWPWDNAIVSGRKMFEGF